MSVELLIRRPDGEEPITLDEWITALREVEGVRQAQSSSDGEVFVPRFAEWVRVFRWSKRGVITYDADLLDSSSPATRIAEELAKALEAEIVSS